ncbi:MAG: hypothetical protein QOK28_3691 [Actinomycetota bacterium]|jgi:hypothetical protein
MKQTGRFAIALAAPLLLAVFPLFSLFVQNQSEIQRGVLAWPLVLALGGTALLTGVAFAVTRNAARTALVAAVVVVWFYYGVYFGQRAGITFALWTLVLGAVAAVVVRSRRDLSGVAVLVVVAAVATTAPQVAHFASYGRAHPSLSGRDPRLWPTALAKPAGVPRSAMPDVYVLIPDDYARDDVLTRYFHYDNSAFLTQLERRGFQLSAQIRSPYADSESNIAAAINMDYLSEFPRVLGAKSLDVRPVKAVMQDSRAGRIAKSLGYRYVHMDTDDVTFSQPNPDTRSFSAPDSFGNLWMRKTVLGAVGGAVGFNHRATDARFRTSVRSVFDKLRASAKLSGPKFVVFHTLLPHDPYVFGRRGQAVAFPGRTDYDLATTTGRQYYLRQLEFLNRELLSAVDHIVRTSRTPPVVVIQSDEGFQANPETWGEATMNDIRVKGFGAFLLPGVTEVPDPPTTVNTLRFVFDRYLGADWPMLPARSYPEGDYPYEFKQMRVR